MNKEFEKIIEKLGEEKMSYFLTIANTGDEKLDFAYEQVGNALDRAIEIVNQESEQHSAKNCSECSRRKFYQIGYAEGKKDSDWIPCSERLPEESLNSVIGWDEYRERCCFVQYYGGRWILGDDIDSVKIIAWQPLPQPYQPKGE